MASISYIADICSNADEALERLNQLFLTSHPQADEQEHRQLVATALWEIEGEWRARRLMTETLKRENIRVGWELDSPNPNVPYLLQPRRWRDAGNYDRQPNPWYDNQCQPNGTTQFDLVPFSRPVQQTMRVIEEDEPKPLPPSPPCSPRRPAAPIVAYPPPQGPAQVPPPILFTGLEIKREETDQEQMVQPLTVAQLQAGQPGAAFRANPQVWRGTKQTYRMGQARRHLPYKAAIKSSSPYCI